MTDDQLLRYSRHLLLDEVGVEGQQRLLDAHAVVIGAGGLGSPVALYLAASGVGRITVVDHDQVDLTNLQRQIAHTTERVGLDKARSAASAMRALNPDVQVHAITERAHAGLLDAFVAGSQVVIDCCDNFETRHAVNAACVRQRVPLVSGAVIRFDGQATVFDARAATSPCYACVFPPDQPPPEVACATMGVLAPLAGLIGSLQASEALKLIMGVGSPLVGRLQMLDGKHMAWSELRLQRQADCPVCGSIAH